MVKRTYNGEPIDATEQYLSESPYHQHEDGETVGSTDGDAGKIETQMGGSDDTEKQKRIKEYAVLHPDATHWDIAEETNSDRSYVSHILNGRCRNDREKSGISELTETQSKILFMVASDADLTNVEIADQIGVNDSYVSTLRADNQELIEKIREEYTLSEND